MSLHYISIVCVVVICFSFCGCDRRSSSQTTNDRLLQTRLNVQEHVSQNGSHDGMLEANKKMLTVLNKISLSDLSQPIPSDATLFHNLTTGEALLVARWIESEPSVKEIAIIPPDGSNQLVFTLSKLDKDMNSLVADMTVSFNCERKFSPSQLPDILRGIEQPGETLYEVVFIDETGLKTSPIQLCYMPRNEEWPSWGI